MKILELNDLGPVKNFTKYLRKFGHEVDHIRRNKIKEKIPNKKYDIAHIHYGVNLSTLKFFLNKKIAKKIVIHYHGSDVRDISNLKQYYFKPLIMLEKLRSDLVLFSTPDMSQYTEGVWVPNFADFDLFKPKGKPIYSNRIMVFHKHSWAKNKGLIQRIIKLKSKDYKFDFINGQINHSEIPNLIRKYPLVLGQMGGSYGLCEIESMSCGIPSVFYTSPRIASLTGGNYPSLETLELKKISKFIDEHINDLSFAKKQRKFVETFHNPEKITKTMIKMFEDILNDNISKVDRKY